MWSIFVDYVHNFDGSDDDMILWKNAYFHFIPNSHKKTWTDSIMQSMSES